MNYKILGLLCVFFIAMSTMAFAADPVITGRTQFQTADEYYIGSDYTYFGVNPVVQSGVITDADLDFNILACQYTLYDTNGTNAFAMDGADWNADVNRCQVSFSSSAMYDDYNFNFRVTDVAGGDTNGMPLYVWYDQNAPSTVQTNVAGYGETAVTMVGTDVATNTGTGSGVATYYYSVDSGVWGNNTTGLVTVGGGPGTHTLDYYTVDNLDNNEVAAGGGMNSDSITVSRGSITNQTCNLIQILMLVLVSALVILVVGLMATGNLNIQTIIPVAITAIVFIVILFIMGTVTGIVCVA